MKSHISPVPPVIGICMNPVWRSVASRCFVLLLTLMTTSIAMAQNSDQNQSEDQPVALSEVIVHAQRMDQSLLDTATSALVITGATLEQEPVFGAKDILTEIPDVVTSGAGNFAPAIRGVDGTGPAQGADAFLAGTRPRLNIEIDGRPATYNEIIFGDVGMWDVKQVEFLRGPQSALQGRDSIAGTLAIETNDPTFYTEGSARVVSGNYADREYDAAFSTPLIPDILAFRIAAQTRSSQSFLPMTPFDGISNPGKYEATMVRGKLLIQPTGNRELSTLVTLNYSRVKAPQSETVSPPYIARINSFPQQPVFQPRTDSAIADTTWEIDDGATLKNTLSFTDFDVKRFALVGTGNVNIDGHELIEEPMLKFHALNDQLSGIGGVYYFHNSESDYIDLIGGGTFIDTTRTSAVYSEVTYAFSPQFDVTLGGRYEEEHRLRTGALAFFVIDLDQTYTAAMPKAVFEWHPVKTMTLGVFAERGYNGGGAGFTYYPPFAAYTYGPEYVWDYEGFARASLLHDKLSLTGNVFYSRYHDMQLPFNLSANSIVIRNADQAATHGLEVGAQWAALSSLRLFGNLGVLKTEITSYPGSGAQGNDLPRSPAATLDFGASSHFWGLEFRFDERYSDTYYSDVLDTPRGKISPYWLANAQIGYRFPRAHMRVFAYGTNLFNADNPIMINLGATPSADNANILHPRTFGAGVEVSF